MTEAIEIRPADPSWRAAFAQVAGELATALGPEARIEHVGSTAVPGLAAKPVIDILVGMAQPADVSRDVPELVRLRFAAGETWKPDHPSAFFSRPAARDMPAINVHLTVVGSRQWRDLIQFRTALQRDARLGGRYEALKRRLAGTSRGDLDAYTAGKAAFVAEVLEAAHG